LAIGGIQGKDYSPFFKEFFGAKEVYVVHTRKHGGKRRKFKEQCSSYICNCDLIFEDTLHMTHTLENQLFSAISRNHLPKPLIRYRGGCSDKALFNFFYNEHFQELCDLLIKGKPSPPHFIIKKP
jgi:hypothetical protein